MGGKKSCKERRMKTSNIEYFESSKDNIENIKIFKTIEIDKVVEKDSRKSIVSFRIEDDLIS